MKIGVISDTHVSGGGFHLKKAASRYINKVSMDASELCDLVMPWFADVELIIHAGDFVSFGLVTALSEFGPVEGVSGNMDPGEITSRFPAKIVVNAGGFRIGVMHGSGGPGGIEQRVRAEFDDVDLIVFGHSHYSFDEEVDGVRMLNPGSPTDRRFAPSHSIGLIQLEDSIITEIVELGR